MQRRSKRARWVTVFTIPKPSDAHKPEVAIHYHEKAFAIVTAFQAVGRIVRLEPAQYGGGGLVCKARKP